MDTPESPEGSRAVQASPSIWKKASEILEPITKLSGVIALCIGAWWTYDNYRLHRESAQILDVKLEPQVVAADSDHPTIIVNVTLKNVGRVNILALRREITNEGKTNESVKNCAGEEIHGVARDHEGLELVVIEYSDPKVGINDHRKEGAPKVQANVIDWDEGGGSPKRRDWPVNEYNMIKDNKAFKNCNYSMNPGSTARESVAIPAKSNTLYAIRVRFWGDDGWSEKDITFVHVDKPPSK